MGFCERVDAVPTPEQLLAIGPSLTAIAVAVIGLIGQIALRRGDDRRFTSQREDDDKRWREQRDADDARLRAQRQADEARFEAQSAADLSSADVLWGEQANSRVG